MKKIMSLFLIISLVFAISSICFAETREVEVILNKSIKVTYNDEIQELQNVNGVRVYPLSYEGTTYLPIRSISSLFQSEIKWDGNTNRVYLGEGDLDTTSSKTVSEFMAEENESVRVLLNEEIKIYYNGEVQTFTDVTGKVVYPLSYHGTTYLPVRAVSNLFHLNIDWDEATNTVLIKEEQTTGIKNNILVVYYSAQSHTKAVAEKVAKNLNADIYEIVPKEVYTSDDLDWTNRNSRVTKEHDDESLRNIELVSTEVENWKDYETVLIGYPIWWETSHYVRQNESLLV